MEIKGDEVMRETDEELLQKLQYEINVHQPVPLERRKELAELFGTTPEHIFELLKNIRSSYKSEEKNILSREANRSCLTIIGIVAAFIAVGYLFVGHYNSPSTELTHDPSNREIYDKLPDEGKSEVDARMREYDRVCSKRTDC